MYRLTAEQLLRLNRRVIQDMSMTYPDHTRSHIERIAEMPYITNGERLYVYKRTAEKAACLGRLIWREQPFLKGNRETAVFSMFTLMELNGYHFQDYKRELPALYKALETGEIEEISMWLYRHTTAKRYSPIEEKGME